MQFSAEIAKSVTGHLFHAGLHLVVLLPPEEFVVERVIGRQVAQVLGQLARSELHGVDERMGRSQGAVVGATVDHGDHVLGQNVEELFRDVIVAHGILERQIKFVIAGQNVVAMRRRQPVRRVAGTSQITALAVNVHVDVIAQFFDIRFA